MKNKLLDDILQLAWPTMIQEALAVVVQYADTAMVGVLGASASAIVGVTGSVNWMLNSLCLAFGLGALAEISQAIGAKQHQKVQDAAKLTLLLVSVVGIFFTVFTFFLSFHLSSWMHADVSIQKDANLYFRIINFAMLFKALNFALSAVIRATGDTKSPMLINLGVNVINVIGNFLLIYPSHHYLAFGNFKGIYIYGANLGYKGAAIATMLSFIFGGIMVLRKYLTIFHFDDYHNYNFRLLPELWDLIYPVCLNRFIICFGHVVFSSIVASLGVISTAAHTIAINGEQAFYIPGYGFQAAASTLTGNAIGESDEKKVKKITYIIIAMTSLSMFVLCIFLFIYSNNIMMIFTRDTQVITLGGKVLKIVAVSEPIYGALIILEGVFNGMGDNKAPFIFSLITIWGIRISGSFIVVSVLHLGLEAVWVMMVCDNVARCLLLLQRFIRGKWKYKLELYKQ